MRNTKNSVFTSLISLLLCVSMLLGTTFAWFTDIVSSDKNVIQSGNLDAQMFYSEDYLAADDAGWKDASNTAVFTHQNWEPGYTDLKYVKIYNDGSLNFKWKLTVEADGPVTDLADVIDVYYVNPANNEITYLSGLESVGTLTEVMSKKTNSTGRLEPGQSAILAIAFHMQESAGNSYQDKYLCENGFSLKLIAAQDVGESDSFGDKYDDKADWDESSKNFTASAPLSNVPIIYGNTVATINIGGTDGKSAVIPSGVKVAEGATSLDLAINAVDGNDNLTLDNGATATSMDVHIHGVAADNTQPMIVNLGAILAPGLDATELKLYHTESGTHVQMTRVASVSDFSIHNQYTYNAETGEVSIYVATFSVFSAVQTTADVWDGTSDTSWYNENDTEFTLTTAEQFAGFRDLVDGGNTFAGKTVKLGADIDLNKKQFDPIGKGYDHLDGQAFKGIFDGENHTIYNLAQNGWELGYSYGTMGAGLFASIKDATIKNIAISGANIVMECVDMGVLVGYAQGTCHFENIVITDSKLANYQRYSGGVVGEVSFGPYGIDTSLGYSHTFENITVDSTVKLSSLWGDFDNANGGVIGGKWGDATVKMENVVVAAELDVFSDVTAAYQWYAYRRCGMLIGHTEQNSPKKALNAAAEFLTCKNVNVYYGDWVNYTYYQFADQDSATGQRYPWVRAEAGEHNAAFSNPRYGVPTYDGVKVTDGSKATSSANITFGQLYGGGQGVYGCNEHEGVSIQNLGETKTIYIFNNLDWQDLKLQYWFQNGEDTWTTNIDGISMDGMITAVENVYKVTIPYYAHGIKVTDDGGNNVEYILSDLTDGHTYKVDGNALNVAAVNGTFYETLEEAIANANGGTVTLVNNVILQESLVIDGVDVTLNLNGKTISAANDAEIVEVLLAKNGANVVITGNGTMLATGEGEDVEHVEVISAIDGANVIIKNGTFISDGCTAVYATRGATVSIYGGHYEAKEIFDGRYFTLDVNEAEGNRGTIVVYGGSYVNFDPANHTTDGVNYTNKLANECFKAEYEESTKAYTVVANHNFVDGTCNCGCKENTIQINISDYATENNWSNGTQYLTVDLGNGITAIASGAGNTGKYYTSGENWRLYQSESAILTINSTYSKIISVKVTYTSDNNGVLKHNNDKVASGLAVGVNDYNITFEIGNTGSATNGQVRVTAIELTYMIESHNCAKNEIGANCTENAICGICGIELLNTALGHDYTGTNPYICANNCGVHKLPEAGSKITIQEALWISETLANGKETSNKYVITGVIDDEDHPSDTGATTITADGYSIYITNIHNADGYIRHDAFTVKFKDDDTITVSAKIAKNNSGEAQLHETWLANHTDIDPADHTCDICGATEIIDHVDENGDKLCDICGKAIVSPETPTENTVSMDIFANKGTFVNKVITWTSGDVAVSNAQGSSTSAINTTDADLFRVYANSTFMVSATNITKVVITCTSSSYATACETSFKNAGYTSTVNGSVVTITLATPVDSITAIASAQFRINKVEVTYSTASSEGGSTEPEHTCESVCSVCGKCTDNECTEVVCENKCKGHATAPTTTTVSKSHTEIASIAGVSMSGGNINGTTIKLDDNISIVCAKGGSTSNPAIYGESIRLYQNGATLTIKGTGMTTIVITLANDPAGDGPIAVTGGTADNASAPTNYVYTITVDEGVSEVVITTKGTDKNNRLYVANIEVTYTK